jgi:hypothetical protein
MLIQEKNNYYVEMAKMEELYLTIAEEYGKI